jgi:KDO2-lipid IV(A) lauroyltransferase
MARARVTFVHRLVYAAARVAIAFAWCVPEIVAYRLASWLGQVYFLCAPRRRRFARRLLRNAFPGRADRELRAIARRATGNLFMVPLDLVHATRWLARGRFLERVEVVGAPVGGLPPGPWIGVTAHLGSWEVAGITIAHLVPETHAVVRVFKNPLLQQFLARSRQACGLHLHARRGGVKDLARALARGAVGLQVVDQNQRLRGVFAPFFGELASCERGAAALALRGGYALRSGWTERLGRRFRFRMHLDGPIPFERTGDRRQDLARLVAAVNRRIEGYILRCPDQYLWIHDRYRTRPPAEPSLAPDADEATA